MASNKILVIGSSNTDLIAKTKRIPAAGETVEGKQYLQAMGGKGANQALAAHKLGGDVKFITSLGNDTNGKKTLKYYKKIGLDVGSSLIVKDIPSGTAMIWVDDNGENRIIINPGANKELSSEYMLSKKEEIVNSDVVLLQMEIPYDTVKTICEMASVAGKKVILNVAPAYKIDYEIIQNIDVLIVNETEAELISGKKINIVGAEGVINCLLELGVKSVVLTLGKNGCIMKDKDRRQIIVPAFDVKAIDTTAAGDTFCGGLVAELSRGHDWKRALNFASAASAICVTQMGAQPSIPSEVEVEYFLKDSCKYQN
ncbi:ribokinase [Mariniflexile maritimum]|uniref:ribokinase n=1 Tax=Mariniflexile maritimum TaxID=2682493 RepID=UPI0012F641BF|nr:ribokinase [Mariniflexile maritimum]